MAGTARAEALRGPQPLDWQWEQDAAFRIEWKETWAATAEANRDRWRKELESAAPDGRRRDRLSALRAIRLCTAALERFGQELDVRLALYGAMAEALDRLGSRGAANYWRKRIADECPGSPATAVAAYTRILEMTARDPRGVEEGEAWVEHAAERLVALHRAGHLPAGHPAIRAAWQATFEQAMRRHRYWEAANALGEWAAHNSRASELHLARAELLLQAGRVRDATALLADLVDEGEEGQRARGRLRQLERLAAEPPAFPASLRAEAALDQLHALGADAMPEAVQNILDRAAREEALVPWERGRCASLWSAVDQLLHSRGVGAAVRAAQQRAAGTRVREAAAAGDEQAVFAAWRRWPWAQEVHAALLDIGERALREGRYGLAARCFGDVASHAADPGLRSPAEKGLRLAAEPQPTRPKGPPDRDALKGGVTAIGVPPAAPWLRDRSPGNGDGGRGWMPSAAGCVAPMDGGLLYAGPGVLACYGPDLSRPLWWRSPLAGRSRSRGLWLGNEDDERPGQPFTVAAGAFAPAVAGGRVFSRWGLDASRQCPTTLAAFDAATGEMHWSSAAAPALRDLWPLGNPAVADGRVYALARSARTAPLRAIHLVCLEAGQGTLLWRRFLCSASATLLLADGAPPVPREQVDVATHGAWLAVSGGAVLCMPSAGFVARCDGRDGLVEWARSYPSVRPGAGLPALLRRRGAPPVLCGNAVVFLPRDTTGAFALDVATGKLLWEDPFVPSDGAAGVLDGHVLLYDDRWVVSVEGATGRIAWARRFDEGIAASPVLDGTQVVVPALQQAVRLHAATGVTAEAVPRQAGASVVAALVPHEGALAAIADVGAVPRGEAPLLPRPTGALSQPGLPLALAWGLARRDLVLEHPPAEAKPGDRLYVRSEGLLECLAPDAQGGLQFVWQRAVCGELLGIGWAEGAMLLVGPERVACLDAATGAQRWTAELPFACREWAVCGRGLFVGNLRAGRRSALLRLDTGEVLWRTRFLDALGEGYRDAFDGVAWSGERLHFFMAEADGSRRLPAEIVVEPRDGAIAAVRRPAFGPDRWPHRLVGSAGYVVGVWRQGAAFCYSLRDGALARYEGAQGVVPDEGDALSVAGPWVQVRGRSAQGEGRARTLILRLGDPAYALTSDLRGRIVGDTLYGTSGRGRSLAALNLATRQEAATYVLPEPRGQEEGRILDFAEAGDSLWVASSTGEGGSPARHRVRIDLFARAGGRHLGGQELAGVAPARLQLAWARGTLLVADAGGLQAFVPMPPDTRPARTFRVALRAEQVPRLGGPAGGWPKASCFPLHPEAAGDGVVQVTHDRDTVYVAVRRANPRPTPWLGPGGDAEGDALEVALAASGVACRWLLGLDQNGRAMAAPQGRGAVPRGLRAAICHDVLRGETLYEMAIPKDALFRAESKAPQEIALALAAWDGPGRDPGLSPHAARAQTVHLDTLSPEQHAAAAALARELPDLPAARALLDRECARRAGDPHELAEFCWDALAARPEGAQSVALLWRIAEALARQGAREPVPEVLRRAARAGVPQSVLRRFEVQATSCLSQWLQVAEGAAPQTLMVELSDGSGSPHEWAHRAFWGRAPWHWDARLHWLDRRETVPVGQWAEMRIPLRAVGMEDEPLCGISFFQQGGGRVAWERTAVVAGVREAEVIAGGAPRGFLRGAWEWVAEPVRTGPRAHTSPPPPEPQAVRKHAIDLERPIVAHLEPPLEAPCISQWVFLDPARPPEMLSLDLHDGTRWSFAALWGAKQRYGRYLGPLPEPGKWQELRVPLAWTPLAARPIAGIAFGHVGGRVLWGRTALVAGGKEHVLIGDGTPPVRPDREAGPWLGWRHPGQFHYVGGTQPAAGKLGAAICCDGRTGYVEVPHADALEPATLSAEAWVRFDLYPAPGETRRWIVNKNRHESTDGHYGLVVNRDQVGAYLNMGGGEAGRSQAWSGPGTLQLRRWHHIAMTYDGAVLRVYADGAKAASQPVHKPRTRGAASLQIGRRQDGYVHFHGEIDEVRLYNRALSADEVRARFASGGRPPEGAAAEAVVAHWGFDADALPAAPAAQWRWVEQPSRAGRRAHAGDAAQGFTAHCVAPLAAPFTQHLPFDLAQATASLKANIPRLGESDLAWDFFEDLLGLQTAPERRADLCRWFLSALPGHPAEADALAVLWRACFEAGDPDPMRTVDAFVRDHPVSPRTLYHARRSQACRILPPDQVWPYLIEPFLALKAAKPLPAGLGPGAVDLLKLADPAADAAGGAWQKLDGQLASTSHGAYARVGIPLAIQGSYQLEAQFTRAEGDCVALMLPVGNTAALLVLGGWGGRTSGLAFLGGRDADANETTRDGRFSDGEKHTVAVRVRLLAPGEGEVSVSFDGAPYLKWRGALAALAPDPAWGLPRRDIVGLGAYNAIVVFHSCHVETLDGAARRLR